MPAPQKLFFVTTLFALTSAPVNAQIYLNDTNITVALGASMAPQPFSNRTTAESLASIIDAASAASAENHLQNTHVWISGGVLEIDFDFGVEYDLTDLHFWNYFGESYDVDNIDFVFFDASMVQVGTLLGVMPALGGAGGNPIFAETIPLSFPSQVRFVNAVLTGTNGQVDFNNLGFTGALSCPPATSSNYGAGLAGTLGVPSFTSSAPPSFGAAIALDLSNSTGSAGALAVIGLGLNQLSVSALGGTILVDVVALPWFTMSATGGSTPLQIPTATVFCGFEVFAQGLVVDAGAVQGFALSPGLRLEIGS